MRALSVIGIVLSMAGIIAAIYVMSASVCECNTNDNLFFDMKDQATPAAIRGGTIMLMFFVFFLVFSIIGTAMSFSPKKEAQPLPAYPQAPANTYPPFHPNQYTVSNQWPQQQETQQAPPQQQNTWPQQEQNYDRWKPPGNSGS
ncbi:MAG TPA: hypothetical protein VFU15_09865 [Bacteroidia bacterium]|nr:hypothetical protein [Bacteroidia bacterium]